MAAVVSLVMSDIVDSTHRWNADERAMAADLEQHDRLVRAVLEGAGGSVFKHTGDGMIAAFHDPVAAATAAALVQRTIAAQTWEHPDGLLVRAAVHTGVVHPRDGDLFGTAVNRVARLLAVCPPGAVLVSGATAEFFADRSPEGLTVQRLGLVTLAGFTTPDEVHTLAGPGLTAAGSVADSHSTQHKGDLPAIDDELVGRGEELATIHEALGRSRLVTLIGPGGIGKSRLALEMAASHSTAHGEGAWWIDLASAISDDAVLPVAMAAVGARVAPGRTAVQAFGDRFARVTGLVVFDNCEHVLTGTSQLVTTLRTVAPDIRIVCTSREALGLRGEQIVAVGSLPPDDGYRLFRIRALAVQPALDLITDRAVVERICNRLDGIPLAIGLAAARCRSMTPAEIDARLDDRFRLLRGGRNGAERHRTLQAAVDWSYSLLDDDERAVFDQLAVFAGGTLLDGLCAVTGLDQFDALDIVDRLVGRSMVVATPTTLGTRFQQFETLRQFAGDRLVDSGTIDATRTRHLEWIAGLAADLSAACGLEAETGAFARFDAELDNFRIAVAYATSTGAHEAAHRIVVDVRYLAIYLPAFEVFDWVRPAHLDGGWTEAAATCAAFGAMADCARGLQYQRVPSVEEVPEWYPHASTSGRSIFVSTHLLSGGGWRVALDLLDACDCTTAADREYVALSRINALAVCVTSGAATAEQSGELDALVVAALHRVNDPQADRKLSAAALCLIAWSVLLARPGDAAAYARQAIELAQHLGAEALVDSGFSGLGTSLAFAAPSVEVLETVRDRIGIAVGQHRLGQAVLLSLPVAMLVGRLEPETYLQYVAVLRHHDFAFALPDHELTGLPEEARHALQRQTEGMSVVEAIRTMLGALDRIIAAGSVAGSGTGGAR